MGGLINLEKLGQAIEKVEGVFKTEGLDFQEKQLVLNEVNKRFRKQAEIQKAADLIRDMPMGDMVKGLQKQMEGGDEDGID